jgi:acyl-[acyl-carrier-protein] desaturase
MTVRGCAPPTDTSTALPFTEMRAIVGPAVQRGVDRMWSLNSLDWSAIRPEQLTVTDRYVVRFTTFIEDHVPGYVASLMETFPTVGQDIDLETFCTNREYFRYLISWAYDEQRHASALTRYQIEAGMAEEDALLRDLAAEGRKVFAELPRHPLEAFTYTMVQEKATHLFYQRFQEVAQEPVLRALLRSLGRDEARHFALYSQLVAAYLRRHGILAVPHLKQALQTFKMPLATSLTDYWRSSLRVTRALRFDVTDAYEPVARLVSDLADSPGDPNVADLMGFVTAMRRLP